MQTLCPRWNLNPLLLVQIFHNKKAAIKGYIKFLCRPTDWERQKENLGDMAIKISNLLSKRSAYHAPKHCYFDFKKLKNNCFHALLCSFKWPDLSITATISHWRLLYWMFQRIFLRVYHQFVSLNDIGSKRCPHFLINYVVNYCLS